MSTSNEPPDLEARETSKDVEKCQSKPEAHVDIEHVHVQDDPRKWPSLKKNFTFLFVSYAAMGAAMSANIFLPAIDDLQRDLDASQQVINLSVSLFVLLQGTTPILWSGISEIIGRRPVYLAAYSIFTVSQIVCATAKNQGVFLAFRVIGAIGSSAGLTIGGGSLADIFDTEERGTKIGLYYVFPLLGPSVGTLLGGALTLTSPGWRAAFWFMVAYGASCVIWALFVKDTFRRERSTAWNKAYKRAEAAAKAKDEARKADTGHHTKRKPWSRSGTRSPTLVEEPPVVPESNANAQEVVQPPPQLEGGRPLVRKITTQTGEEVPIKIHLSDINPLAAAGTIMKSPVNALAIVASGLLFGAQYSLSYTAALSFAAPPYNFNSLIVGLILLCYGAGNIVGSVCGGRYSDIILGRRKVHNNGHIIPEWRLNATLIAMPFVPLAFLAYAWTVNYGVPVAAPCVILFITGLSAIWVYSATLSYIVDSSVGMASSAISCNSASRGIFGFIGSQTAQPLLDSIGNGWLYTLWAFLNIVGLGMLCLVCWKGHQWREEALAKKEARKQAAEKDTQTQ